MFPACQALWKPFVAARLASPKPLRSPAPHRPPVCRPICICSTDKQPDAAASSSDKPSSSGGKQRRRFTFAERCQQLARFREQHGHTRVPVQEPTGLGAWVRAKRHAWKAGQLLPSQQQQLAALGFCVDAYDDAWAAHFSQLAAFHSEHGHCHVPREQYPSLHAWLRQQQLRWRQGTLPDERRRRLAGLAGLGLFHAPHEAAWDQRYAELLAFKEEHGHADVPARWPPHPALAAWVEAQRRRWRGTQGAPLTASQHSRLISCGFRFELQQRGDGAWEGRYAQLLQLQQQRGGSLANWPLPEADGLRQWATAQRQLWRQGALAPHRAARLAALGLLRGARERWLDQLAELDGLVACLGLPAVHALLVLAPSATAAAALAEAAVQAAGAGGSEAQDCGTRGCHDGDTGGSGGGVGGGGVGDGGSTARQLQNVAGPRLAPAEAAAAARWWFRHLRSAAVPARTAHALRLRGLACLLLVDW